MGGGSDEGGVKYFFDYTRNKDKSYLRVIDIRCYLIQMNYERAVIEGLICNIHCMVVEK